MGFSKPVPSMSLVYNPHQAEYSELRLGAPCRSPAESRSRTARSNRVDELAAMRSLFTRSGSQERFVCLSTSRMYPQRRVAETP